VTAPLTRARADDDGGGGGSMGSDAWDGGRSVGRSVSVGGGSTADGRDYAEIGGEIGPRSVARLGRDRRPTGEPNHYPNYPN